MKREICCKACSESWRRAMRWNERLDKRPGEYPSFNEDEEGMRQLPGKALARLVCDGCGEQFAKGDDVVAVSLYSRYAPYFAWEEEYIAIEGKPVLS